MNSQLREFLDYLRLNRNASSHTVLAYESDLGQVLDFTAGQLGKPRSALKAVDLDRGAIRAFLADLYRQGHARASVARKVSALRTFTRFLRREGWVESDPVATTVPPRRDHKVPAHLSVEEMARLLDMPDASSPLGRRDRSILELFYASGLRLSELVGLDLPDVDLRSRMVRVMGKGAKERLVPFNASAERAIRTWLDDRRQLRRGPAGADARTVGPQRRVRSDSRHSSEPLFVNFRGDRLTGRSGWSDAM
jgi:integrase/recombinase XerC